MVGALGLVAALILAAVFAAAGIAKLADRTGTRTAVREFGAPESLGGLLALVLPVAELTVAILLLLSPTRAVGAAGALVLLGVFSVAIAVSLARGRTPDCHCFGQLHSAPAGPRTLARNALLAGLGVVVLVEGLNGVRPSAVAWVSTLGATALLALAGGAVAAGFAYAFLSQTRSYGRLLLRLDALERRLMEAGIGIESAEPEIGLKPGTPAPRVGVVEGLLDRGAPLLLFFTSPSCRACEEFMPTVATWQRAHADELTIETTEDERIHAAFDVDGTPSAVLIASDGTVASWIAMGAEAIKRLLERAASQPDDEPEGRPIGALAPSLSLPTLGGETLSFDELTGEETVVLFWNPGCGFCRSMHERLVTWEQTARAGSPRLVVVSSGGEAATAADGFASTVLLDPEFALGDAFAAGGTPMAVLLDSDGRVASPLVAGAEAVFALTEKLAPPEFAVEARG